MNDESRGLGPFLRDVVALAKPRVTTLVLFTTSTGVLLVPGKISWPDFLLLLLGTGLVVASANTLNCWMERDTDALMRRTRNRPIPAGRIAPRTALVVGVIEAVVAIPVLYLVSNLLTAALGLFALVTYVLVYTPLKRRSPIALTVGAVPGAIPPLMGLTAVTGEINQTGLALFAILFVWQLPHFIAISLYLKEDYARGGLKVLPLVRSDEIARRHLLAWTVALVPTSLVMVPLGVAGTAYLLTAVVLGAAFLYFGILGLKQAAGIVWARRTFLYSIVYLTVLVAVLVVDRA